MPVLNFVMTLPANDAETSVEPNPRMSVDTTTPRLVDGALVAAPWPLTTLPVNDVVTALPCPNAASPTAQPVTRLSFTTGLMSGTNTQTP